MDGVWQKKDHIIGTYQVSCPADTLYGYDFDWTLVSDYSRKVDVWRQEDTFNTSQAFASGIGTYKVVATTSAYPNCKLERDVTLTFATKGTLDKHCPIGTQPVNQGCNTWKCQCADDACVENKHKCDTEDNQRCISSGCGGYKCLA